MLHPKKGVGGDHQVCAADLLCQFRAAPGLRGPDGDNLQPRHESGCFLRPGADDTGGRHGEHRCIVKLTAFPGAFQ